VSGGSGDSGARDILNRPDALLFPLWASLGIIELAPDPFELFGGLGVRVAAGINRNEFRSGRCCYHPNEERKNDRS
jgi:hypothetical protein